MLASWLFAQYLLTNEVQIAYAGTEGYVPVTSKAQESDVYVDYLSREGEDNTTYYKVKLQASKLMLEHVDDTFVTPVFNGSASLRDASGQLIENVVKSARRKETIDETYMEHLFQDVTSLYRLDQGEKGLSGKADLGPLPKTAVLLLGSLAGAWILILVYVVVERKRQSGS